MSLFFEDRMKEQIEDPANDKIVFTYPWIIEITPQNEQINFDHNLLTFYHLETEVWLLELSQTGIKIFAPNVFPDGLSIRAWNGSACFISYNLFYDNDMRFLLHLGNCRSSRSHYSSPRTKMTDALNEDIFETPDRFMTKFVEAFNKKKLSKAVIFIELHLPQKWFYRPFDNPTHSLSKKFCDEYPPDLENHYKFSFLKLSDYSIKCRDGTVPALKMVLNISSQFMINHFKETNGNELVVNFLMDVLKPVIYCLHSRCFEMPASYDLDYARRLLEVIDFFQPIQSIPIRKAVHQSLCRKFVQKTTYSFDSLLPWLSLASKNRFYHLGNMITSMIASKYYFKWHQIFPENARNIENPIFRDVFGPRDLLQNWIFARIESTFIDSYQTNIILP